MTRKRRAHRFLPPLFMIGWIGITLGDITGVGAEVALKAVAAELPADDIRYLLIGDEAHLRHLNEQLHLQLSLQPYRNPNEPGRIFFHDSHRVPLSMPMPP